MRLQSKILFLVLPFVVVSSTYAGVTVVPPREAWPKKMNITLQLHIQGLEWHVFERNLGYFCDVDGDSRFEFSSPSGTYLALFAHEGDGTRNSNGDLLVPVHHPVAPNQRHFSLLEIAQMNGATLSVFMTPEIIFSRPDWTSDPVVSCRGRSEVVAIQERIATLREVMKQKNIEFFMHSHSDSTLLESHGKYDDHDDVRMDEFFHLYRLLWDTLVKKCYPVTVPAPEPKPDGLVYRSAVPGEVRRISYPGGYCLVPQGYDVGVAGADEARGLITGGSLTGVPGKPLPYECGLDVSWTFGTGNYTNHILRSNPSMGWFKTFWSNGEKGADPGIISIDPPTPSAPRKAVYINTTDQNPLWAFPGGDPDDPDMPKTPAAHNFPRMVSKVWENFIEPNLTGIDIFAYSPQTHTWEFYKTVPLNTAGLKLNNPVEITEPSIPNLDDADLELYYVSRTCPFVNFTTLWETYRAFVARTDPDNPALFNYDDLLPMSSCSPVEVERK
jgi:hypothetical protein